MSPRIPDTHAEAWALLPWLANGRLASEDREWVEAHVHSCAECRAELASQRMVGTQMNRQMNSNGAVTPAAAASEEQRSFNKLWARIEVSESLSGPDSSSSGSQTAPLRSSRTVRWLAAAVIVQAIGLGVFAVSALKGGADDSPKFTTVSALEPRLQAPAVRIVFAPEASIGTINTLLTHQGLRIVAGPGTSGNYTAELSPDAVASGASANSVAAVISNDPNVSFAQPVAR